MSRPKTAKRKPRAKRCPIASKLQAIGYVAAFLTLQSKESAVAFAKPIWERFNLTGREHIVIQIKLRKTK